MLSFFPLDVLDEIWDVIESVSGGFLTSLRCGMWLCFVIVLDTKTEKIGKNRCLMFG